MPPNCSLSGLIQYNCIPGDSTFNVGIWGIFFVLRQIAQATCCPMEVQEREFVNKEGSSGEGFIDTIQELSLPQGQKKVLRVSSPSGGTPYRLYTLASTQLFHLEIEPL